jgi:methylated-DNA-[protein]-cysteine S-methyltransferase
MPVVTTQLIEAVRVVMPPYYPAPARLASQIRTSSQVVRIRLAAASRTAHTGFAMNNNTYTWTQDSPIGKLAISTEGDRVVLIKLPSGRAPAVKRRTEMPPEARAISKAFERYFDGDVDALDRIKVDLKDVNEFRRTVLTTLRKLVVPGMTISYGELAAAVGHPGAARAVGTAMATNPAPIILPCHRVLASDGTLGGYGGGLKMKRQLLELEGVPLSKEGRRR